MNSPSGSHVRPTTDKLRGSIFSILDDAVADANVLDAFCGTGALGIEAYSRGAKSVDFLDIDTAAINMNSHLLPKGSYNIYSGNFLTKGATLSKQYDLIFFDPPYAKYSSADILKTIVDANLLADRGLVIYEEFYKTEFLLYSDFQVLDERKYGDTIIRFLNIGG